MLESNFDLSQASWHLERSSFDDYVERKGSLEGGGRWFPFRERKEGQVSTKNLLASLMNLPYRYRKEMAMANVHGKNDRQRGKRCWLPESEEYRSNKRW